MIRIMEIESQFLTNMAIGWTGIFNLFDTNLAHLTNLATRGF